MEQPSKTVPYSKQSSRTLEYINKIIYKHLEERDWLSSHTRNSRNLAISISLEANELLEHYQWQDEPIGDKQAIADELADVLIYAFSFATVNEIDIAVAIEQKLEKSAQKYPAEQFKNKTANEKRQNWIDAKLKHRKENL